MDQPTPFPPRPEDPTARHGLGQRELILMLGMATAVAALGIDTMLPAFAQIRRDLGLEPDSTRVGNIITFYFFGMAAGQLVWGPVADRFGRRRTLRVALSAYVVAAVAAALSPTLGLVLLTRTLWGFCAAGPRIVSMTVVRDSFEGDRVSQAMSSLMAVFIIVPIVAPSIGATAVALASWRWLFGFCALFATVVLAWSTRLGETLRPEHRMELSARRLATAGRTVLSHRASVCYLLAVTCLMGSFVTYLSGLESVVHQAYDRASWFPVIFGGLAAVMGAMMLVNRRLVGRFGPAAVARAVFGTEVLIALAGSVLVSATGGRPPLWAFLVVLAGIVGCQGILLPNLTAMALEPMGALAGTASSVIGAFQTGGGAILGGLVLGTFDGTTRPLIYGFALFSLLGAVFVLAGTRAQARSRAPEPAAV